MGDWIQMGIKKREHSTSLRRIFLQFIFMTGVSVCVIIILYAFLMGVALYHGLLLPADTYSDMVEEYAKEIEAGTAIHGADIPPEIKYAAYDKAGKVKETSFSAKELKKVDALRMQEETEVMSSYFLQRQYRLVKGKQETWIFEYYITAEFASPFLRSHFAHVEWTLFGVGVLLVLCDILCISMLYAKRLKKKVACMKETAEQIKNKNLEFDVRYTGINEFDDVMTSLLDLKDSLSESLNEQWSMREEKKRQMGALAHDIKTPLTVIRGNAELLAETELNQEQGDYLIFIQNNIGKMQQYVKKLIEMSRGSQNEASMQEICFSDFLMRVKEEAAPVVRLKEMTCEVISEVQKEDTLWLEVDMGLRAVMNLVDNAVQYSDAGTAIEITGWVKGEFAFISVTDEGTGFAPEALKYGTREFYRSNPTRNASWHLGMGLFIAEKMAQFHGGELLLANTQKGAKVILKIKKDIRVDKDFGKY